MHISCMHLSHVAQSQSRIAEMDTLTKIYMHTYNHTDTHRHTHTYIHTCIHTYIHHITSHHITSHHITGSHGKYAHTFKHTCIHTSSHHHRVTRQSMQTYTHETYNNTTRIVQGYQSAGNLKRSRAQRACSLKLETETEETHTIHQDQQSSQGTPHTHVPSHPESIRKVLHPALASPREQHE